MEVEDKFQSKATGDQSLSSSVHNSPCKNGTSDDTSRKLLLQITNVKKELQTCFNQEKKQTHVSKRTRIAKPKANAKIPKSQVMGKPSSPYISIQPSRRKKRKAKNPSRMFFDVENSTSSDNLQSRSCKNSQCSAVMCIGDRFCRECSCCICYLFDENRDNSLWLKCSSNSGDGESCGRACHVECAIQNEMVGVVDLGLLTELDGSYCCPHCGNVSDIIWCWKKQLDIARDAARLDGMYHRVLLCYRLLDGTLKHKELHDIVSDAKAKLEAEIGLIVGINSGIISGDETPSPMPDSGNNRWLNSVGILPTCDSVQSICALATERADELLATYSNKASKFQVCRLILEQTTPTSILLTVLKSSSSTAHGYKLWYNRTLDEPPSADPACVFSSSRTRILISDLRPSTSYTFSITPFSVDGDDLGRSEAEFSTVKPSYDTTTTAVCPSGFRIRDIVGFSNPVREKEDMGVIPKCLPDLNDPAPYECVRESGSSVGGGSGWLDEGFEQCVRVVRGLEKGGNISSEFRMKLLTWLGLWSTEGERRVVKTFMWALSDDPGSMAGQLTHLFTSVVSKDES